MKHPVVPSLGGEGWVVDAKRQLNTLFAYALVSDYSQSNLYKDTITSIPYIVAKHQSNQADMVNELENALTTLYGKFFPTVEVKVSYDDPTTGVYNLYISIIITSREDGKLYSLSATAPVDNGILKNVLFEINQ